MIEGLFKVSNTEMNHNPILFNMDKTVEINAEFR